MTPHTMRLALAAFACVTGATLAEAETMVKQGTNASGGTCTVTVNRNPDGSITTGAASGGGGSGAISSSSSAGGTSVQVQAGGGSVSSSSSTSGGPGARSSSASTVTVNGCTISTSSP